MVLSSLGELEVLLSGSKKTSRNRRKNIKNQKEKSVKLEATGTKNTSNSTSYIDKGKDGYLYIIPAELAVMLNFEGSSIKPIEEEQERYIDRYIEGLRVRFGFPNTDVARSFKSQCGLNKIPIGGEEARKIARIWLEPFNETSKNGIKLSPDEFASKYGFGKYRIYCKFRNWCMSGGRSCSVFDVDFEKNKHDFFNGYANNVLQKPRNVASIAHLDKDEFISELYGSSGNYCLCDYVNTGGKWDYPSCSEIDSEHMVWCERLG